MTREPRSQAPMFLHRGGPLAFPDPELTDDEGLVAIGGDLSEERLRHAYMSGVFPCYGDDTPPLWWSPSPRAIISPERLHVSSRLERRLRQGRFTHSWDRAFREVMVECGDRRADGRWILPEMIEAYVRLHRAGSAHSLEVWEGSKLVGGLYGVRIGSLFAAESMFHRVTDASKVALVVAVRETFAAGIELFDVQYLTDHLSSMGAIEIPRPEFLSRLRHVTAVELDFRP